MDRAISFYSQVFQAKIVDHRPQSPTATLQLHQSGSGITLFQTDDEHPSGNGLIPYLNCNERLQQALPLVRLNGGEVITDIQSMEPFGVRAVIKDSEGNRLALHSSQ